MSNYARNKIASRTHPKGETMTDQSAAHETDRTVIVQRFLQHGQAPGSKKPPMFGDFSRLPTDLKGFINMGKSMKHLKGKLPAKLKDKSIEELLALTPEQLTNILTPPAPSPAPEEKPK